MKSVFGSLCFVLFTLVAVAAEPVLTLVTPTAPVPAGGKAQVDLVAMNPGAVDLPFATTEILTGRLEVPGGSREVTLEAVARAPAAVSPGGFVVRHYQLTVPPGVSGHLVLEVTVSNSPVLRAVLDVEPGEIATEAVETPLAQRLSVPAAAATLSRTFVGRFMPNMPVYFLYGNTTPAVKFQISFDYRLATLNWGEQQRQNVSTLRVGYTQRSLWDIKGNSSPFYDSSYMPELAINTDATVAKGNNNFTWMGWRAGLQHESNGRDGADSRSLNIVYLRPRFVIGSLDAWAVAVLPEVFAYVGDIEDNPQIKDYRGYGRLRIYAGKSDGVALMFTGWMGKDFNHGSYQLDLTYPLRIPWMNIETFLQLQYFNGYGESLRAYDQKSDALRFGIGLVR